MHQEETISQRGLQAQKRYCEENKLPFFIHGGTCFRCGMNVFNPIGGYSEEYAKNHLITGCPFCNYSFCD